MYPYYYFASRTDQAGPCIVIWPMATPIMCMMYAFIHIIIMLTQWVEVGFVGIVQYL